MQEAPLRCPRCLHYGPFPASSARNWAASELAASNEPNWLQDSGGSTEVRNALTCLLASNGEVFLGDENSIAAITNHWNAARHRAQLSLPQQLSMVAMVQDLLQPLHRDYAGVRPTMADLAKAVKHRHGAPGPDQWTSSELRALPLSLRKDGKHTAKRLKVFRTVSRLICVRLTRFLRTIFWTPETPDLLTVNIYSCWYRLFASMWAQSDSMKHWYKEPLPSSILGGPETQQGADMVTSELHDLLHIDGFFATLNLSQAFDNIQAEVATTSMRTLGIPPIPPRLTGVLRRQWLHQQRWMTWNKCVSERQ